MILQKANIETIKEVISILNNDMRHEATNALNLALDELETRINEEEFCEFCENL